MNASMATTVTQAQPQLSPPETGAAPVAELKSVDAQKVEQGVKKDDASVATDKVTLSEDARLAGAADKQKKDAAEAAKADQAVTSQEAAGSVAKVEFVYDAKGVLRVKYMDTANRLVYQVPSEMMIKMKEAAKKADASVNTSV